jgi:hypothetical protein
VSPPRGIKKNGHYFFYKEVLPSTFEKATKRYIVWGYHIIMKAKKEFLQLLLILDSVGVVPNSLQDIGRASDGAKRRPAEAEGWAGA